jgi:hypothetical protein
MSLGISISFWSFIEQQSKNDCLDKPVNIPRFWQPSEECQNEKSPLWVIQKKCLLLFFFFVQRSISDALWRGALLMWIKIWLRVSVYNEVSCDLIHPYFICIFIYLHILTYLHLQSRYICVHHLMPAESCSVWQIKKRNGLNVSLYDINLMA